MRVWCALPAPLCCHADRLSELQSGFTSVFPTTAGFDLTAVQEVSVYTRTAYRQPAAHPGLAPLPGPGESSASQGVVENRLLISICWCVQRVVGGGDIVDTGKKGQ